MREFLWSEDMAEACVYCIENVDFKDVKNSSSFASNSQNSHPTEVRNTHINIGTGKDISIKQVAEAIKAAVGFRRVVFQHLKTRWHHEKTHRSF